MTPQCCNKSKECRWSSAISAVKRHYLKLGHIPTAVIRHLLAVQQKKSTKWILLQHIQRKTQLKTCVKTLANNLFFSIQNFCFSSHLQNMPLTNSAEKCRKLSRLF